MADTKPVVECRLLSSVVIGQKCNVVPYDHPKDQLNGRQHMTTKVISSSITPNLIQFETENTVYKVV